MDIDTKKLIEEIEQALKEDELVDEFDVEVEQPTEDTIAEEPIESEDQEPVELNRTEELDAKTKISRALDTLITQIDDFKNATFYEISSLDELDLVNAVDLLNDAVKKIQDVLDGKTPELHPIENPPMEIEEPATQDDEEVEHNFDDEAGIDLFAPEAE